MLLQVQLPIGAGSLPLMWNNALLPDKEHVILLSPNANSTSGALEDSMRDDMGSDLT